MVKSICLWWCLGLCAFGQPLKVFCWNIHHGRGMDGKIDLERIAAVIAAEEPDLVALQEVDRETGRSGGVDQAAALAGRLEMEAIFGEAMPFSGGGYGLAVLSRLPVEKHEVHRLPGPGEPRIALEVVVRRAGETLSFVSVHLDHQSEEARVAQARTLVEVLADRRRAILFGDLNDLPGSATLKRFENGWTRIDKTGPVATVPAPEPRSEIDHLLLKGFETAGDLRVIEEQTASDHRPLAGTVK